MFEWNLVASVHGRGFTRGQQILQIIGEVHRTNYYNVLVARVEDIDAMLARLPQLESLAPDIWTVISRLAPARVAFNFRDVAEFETKAREAALSWVPDLAGKSFHVRLHRRGFKGTLTSPDEERFLDEALLDALDAAGTPGSIAFDDPDAVIDVETIDNRAGMAFWTREDLQRYPFLKVD